MIELELAPEPAEQTRGIVDSVCRSPSVAVANETYYHLHKNAQRRGLLRRSAKREGTSLDPERLEFAASAADRLIHVMGLEKYEDQLQQLAEHNPLTLMKVVFALYRKVKPLAELQDAGKVFF